MENESLENMLLALSDRTRLQLLGLMRSGEVSVGYLSETLGQSQPKISRHLAYLRNAGLVSTRRDGKWIYYSIIQPKHRAGIQLLSSALEWAAFPSGETDSSRIPEFGGEREFNAEQSEYISQEIEIHLL